MSSSKFTPQSDAEVTQLITHSPLAWMVSCDDPNTATPLPLRPERVENDRIVKIGRAHV